MRYDLAAFACVAALVDRCKGRLYFAYYKGDFLFSIETDYAIRGRYALLLLRLFPRWRRYEVDEVRAGEGCALTLSDGDEAIDIFLM